jgi:hypothetical protein
MTTRLNGPYQIRHTENGKFLVWSELSQEVIRTGPMREADARAFAEQRNVEYYIDQMEARS